LPELPDIVVYIEALEKRILGRKLEAVRLASPFVLRTVDPPLESAQGKTVSRLRRLGKRICIGLDDDLCLVIHLMIAGRLHWRAPRAKLSKPRGLAAFDFSNGTLLLTEAGSQKRASLHMAAGEEGLRALDPGGLEVFEADLESFAARLTGANHTLKRALSDPHLFSGIGNAYSDEILFAAQLSPLALTQKLSVEEIERLLAATRATLNSWVARLRDESGDGFPEKITAFREGMAVHGRYKTGLPPLRLENSAHPLRRQRDHYCPKCQTGGRLLADRALSRLLREDWPRTPEELEMLTGRAAESP